MISLDMADMALSTRLNKTLPVVEAFHSVQGEGFWTGTSAFFIRLAGCDVGCPWCDTKQSWSARLYPKQSIDELVTQAQVAQPYMVVITGGEPLIHDLEALTETLHQAGLRVHLETSGSHPVSGKFDWVSFSPKRFKLPHKNIYSQVSELKVIVAENKDLSWAEEQAKLVAPSVIKLLQPEWHSPNSQQLIFNYILTHPDWQMSLQTHKFLGVR